MTTTETPDVLVLAELNPDVVLRGVSAVRFGQAEQLVEQAALALGSSGAITASALVAQGRPTALCAVVGDDLAGEAALRMLAGQGVDTDAVAVRPDVATGMTVVLSGNDGDRALLTFPGAMAALTVDQVPRALLAAVRHVHVSSFYLQQGLHAGLVELLDAARADGVTTSVDPGWDPAEKWQSIAGVLGHVDHLLPNATECLAIAGAMGHVTDDPLAAATTIAAHGPAVTVKMDTRGAAHVGPAGRWRVAAAPVDVVDSTGAGDNFDAGFLAGLLAGESPDRALARGAACGAVAVTGLGGVGALASPEHAELLANQLTTEEIA
ncbi:MAG: sugar kinase [Nocardioides sp.]|uniref:carbohydrate kinase family protein n=1 Tax=Nocardioides sp. TaxID=35761 RepID=UPI0039E65BE2